MFDLVESINKEPTSSNKQEVVIAGFFSSKECRDFVDEAFRFEGLQLHVSGSLTGSAIDKAKTKHELKFIILDLTTASDVVKEAKAYSAILPTDARVLVIGKEDAITTIRNLRDIGFHYLLWPVAKEDFLSYIYTVNNDKRDVYIGIPTRKAKKIRVMGTKGGVGTTLIASEIAKLLSKKHLSNCIMVDHNYWGGNLDIMMGLNELPKRNISLSTFGTSIDEASAHSMLKKEGSALSILSLTSSSTERALGDMNDYTNAVVDQLAYSTNFIIEDYPVSVGFHNTHLTDEVSCVVMVIVPTVSSLRDAGRLKHLLLESADDETLRIVVVLNYVMPAKYATVSKQEVEDYLKQDIDAVIPYTKNINQLVLSKNDKKLFKTAFGKSLNQLSSVILGAKAKKSKLFSMFGR